MKNSYQISGRNLFIFEKFILKNSRNLAYKIVGYII